MRQVLLALMASVLMSAPALAQADAEKVQVRRSVDRTAVWVGDRVRYTLEFTAPGDLDILAEDVARERLPLKGAEVTSQETSERVTSSGRVRIVQYTIVTFAVNTPEIVVDAFPVRFFSRRTMGDTQVAPAGQVTVPRIGIPIRSTLPDTGRLPELREPATLASPARYLRLVRPVGLALIALAVVPVALILVDVAGHARRLRAGAPRRKARRAHSDVFEELSTRQPASPHEHAEAYERLDHLVREHLELAASIPARALTPAEIAAALRARPRGSHLAEAAQSVLVACERARYAPDLPAADAWPGVLSAAEGIVRTRKL